MLVLIHLKSQGPAIAASGVLALQTLTINTSPETILTMSITQRSMMIANITVPIP